MIYLILISSLFVIGSMLGYLIEVLFRRFISTKKWVNPGFLVGPYIPLYGFGVIILYGLSNIDFVGTSNLPYHGDIIIRVVIIGIMMTLIELVAGLIFIKGMHLKLWDYSKRWGNFKGIICPLFSIIWFLAGCLYYFLLNPYLVKALTFISDNLIYSYFIGGIIGAMIVDAAYSFHLGFKLKRAAGEFTIRLETFRLEVKEKSKGLLDNNKHSFGVLVNELNFKDKLKDMIKDHASNITSAISDKLKKK